MTNFIFMGIIVAVMPTKVAFVQLFKTILVSYSRCRNRYSGDLETRPK